MKSITYINFVLMLRLYRIFSPRQEKLLKFLEGSIPLTVSLPIIGMECGRRPNGIPIMGYLLTEPFRISVPKFFRQCPLDGSKVKSLPFPGFLILHYYQIKLLGQSLFIDPGAFAFCRFSDDSV